MTTIRSDGRTMTTIKEATITVNTSVSGSKEGSGGNSPPGCCRHNQKLGGFSGVVAKPAPLR